MLKMGTLSATTTSTSEKHSGYLEDKTLFLSSDILPIQFFSSRRINPDMEPERRLALAVLADAVRCFQLNMAAQSAIKVREFTEAKTWLFQTEDKGPFSFDSICYLLDIHADGLRKGLRRWRSLKLAGAPSRPLIRHTPVQRRTAIAIRKKTTGL
jgi:hypothetical protein